MNRREPSGRMFGAERIRTVYLSNVLFFMVIYIPTLLLRLQYSTLMQDRACDVTYGYVCVSRTRFRRNGGSR